MWIVRHKLSEKVSKAHPLALSDGSDKPRFSQRFRHEIRYSQQGAMDNIRCVAFRSRLASSDQLERHRRISNSIAYFMDYKAKMFRPVSLFGRACFLER